jgi:hypothetical protein
MGAGELKGWVLLLLVGGWRWPHTTHTPPLAHTPPGPGNTETPHQGQLPALNLRTYDQERGCQVDRGPAMAHVGARTKGGGGGCQPGGGCFLRSLAGVPWYRTSGTHAQARTALRLCNWSALFESPENSSAIERHAAWLGLFDYACGA